MELAGVSILCMQPGLNPVYFCSAHVWIIQSRVSDPDKGLIEDFWTMFFCQRIKDVIYSTSQLHSTCKLVHSEHLKIDERRCRTSFIGLLRSLHGHVIGYRILHLND